MSVSLKTYRPIFAGCFCLLSLLIIFAGYGGRADAQRRRRARVSPAAKPKASPTPMPKPSIAPLPTSQEPTPKPTPTPPPAPGDLDSSFDSDGLLTLAIGTQPANARAIAVQPDGKIVVAGDSYNGSNRDFTVVRFNSNGPLDTSFGVGGKAITDIAGKNDVAFSVAIQPDGKIVAAGYSHGASSKDKDITVVRYTSSGSPDLSFDNDGIVTTDYWTYGGNFSDRDNPIRSDDEVRSIAIQADGKLFVAGSYDYGSYNGTFVARYNTDGSLDKSFSNDGVDDENTLKRGVDIALQRDRKLVLVASWLLSDFRRDLTPAMCRYDPSRGLERDKSFGYNGCFGPEWPDSGSYTGRSVAIQPDGKIVAAVERTSSPGFVINLTGSSSNTDFMLVRHNADGSIDKSFGKAGIVKSDVSTRDDRIASLAIQSNGRIIVGGVTHNQKNGDFALARYLPDGSLDPTWGKNGIVISDFDGYEEIKAIALQDDGKVIVAGSRLSDFAVARYLNPEKTAPPAVEVTRIEPTSRGYKVNPKDLDVFVGKYETANKNFTVEVVKEGASLIIQIPNVKRDELIPVSENHFTVGDSPVRFVKEEKGKVTHLVLGSDGKEIQLKRID